MTFNQYPYTDFHELNLDWIINKIKELNNSFDDFKAVNQITNAGAWDITKNYTSWTIVSDHNKGYISLKPVPAGVPITNNEYWGFVGDYGLVVTELVGRVAALENVVFAPPINKVVFLGDSYQFQGNGWVNGVAEGLGLSEGDYFNYCVSGHGFNSGGDDTWVGDIQRFVNENQSILRYVKDVVIVGGINDATTNRTVLRTSIDSFFAIVKENMPNALVTMAFVGNASAKSTVLYNRTTAARSGCMEYERAAFTANGGRYLGGTENILWQYTLMADDRLHPNQYGVERIVTYVTQALRTGYANVTSYGIIDVNGGKIKEQLNGGTYTLEFDAIKCNSGVTLSDSSVRIINDELLQTVSARNIGPVVANLEIRGTSSTTNVPVLIQINEGRLLAREAYASSSGSYPTHTTNATTYLTHATMISEPQAIL